MLTNDNKEVVAYLHKTEPYAHQQRAFYKCFPLEYFALFMEQGTGKTKTLMDIAANLYQQGTINAVLVIAPNGVHEQWNDTEMPLHCAAPSDTFVWYAGTKGKRLEALWKLCYAQDAPGLKWLFVNVDAFSTDTALALFKEYVKENKCLLVVDEATVIKTPDALRTQNIIKGMARVEKIGKRITGIYPYAVRRAILTGTMVTNGPYDLYSMFEFLKPGFWGYDFYTFKARFGIERKMNIPGTARTYARKIKPKEIEQVHKYKALGKTIEDIANILALSESSVAFLLNNPHIRVPYKNLDKLKEIIAPYAFIVRKEDCLDLPEKVRKPIFVEMNTEQARVYKTLLKEMEAELEGVTLTVVNKLALMLRLQQITSGFFPHVGYDEDKEEPLLPIGKSNPKIDAIIHRLEESSARPVIIATRFRAEIDAIVPALRAHFEDETVEGIQGATPTDTRKAIRADFLAGAVSILVGQTRIISRGFNFQNSSDMIIVSNSFSAEDRAQLEDRIHRNGQKGTCVYTDLIVKGTIDELVYEVLQDKKDLLDYMREQGTGQFIGRLKC